MQEMINKCNHIDSKTGKSTIVFPKVKWRGINPYKIKGICLLCGKTIDVTEIEYKILTKGVIEL